MSVPGESPHLLMANTAVQTGATPAPKSLVARFIGVITSPRETYEAVVAPPKWLGMLAVVAIGMGLLFAGFLFTKTGQDAWLDATINNPFSRGVSDQQIQGMQRLAPFVGYFALVQFLILLPIISAPLPGVLY